MLLSHDDSQPGQLQNLLAPSLSSSFILEFSRFQNHYKSPSSCKHLVANTGLHQTMTKMLPVHLKGTNSSERETDPISTSLKAELEINSIQGAMSAREAPSPPQEPTSTFDPSTYTKPFIEFISNNPTVFHAVSHFSSRLASQGFTQLSERKPWSSQLEPGGSYFLDRNGSGIIAFKIGENYKPGNGVAIIAAHIDALTAKIKPVSIKPKKLGFVELGVAQYGGALNQTWIDRDLGIGGRVFVRDGSTGKVEIQLMKLDWPIARIPSIAPHFGIPAQGSPNREVRMVPIIGIDNGDLDEKDEKEVETKLIAGSKGKFADTQPESLIKAVAGEIRVKNCKFPSYTLISPIQ